VAINLGIPTATAAGISVTGQVTLQDSTLAGIGTVTLNSQGVANATAPYVNTLANLDDSGMTSLTVTGANGATITALTDNASAVSITNNSGGLVTIGGWTTSQLTSLSLTNNVNVTVADSAAGAVTVSGASDNAGASLTFSGVGTHSVTLGNGANVIADGANTGADVISVGTGADTITTGTGSNTISVGASGTKAETIVLSAATANSVTLGAHTGVDAVTVAAHGSAITAVIAGLNTGATSADTITFSGDAGATGAVTVVTSTQINTYANTAGLDATQLSTAINSALDNTHGGLGIAQHSIAELSFQGNTYLVEQANATGTVLGAGDTVVELVGVNTITALSVAAGGVLSFHG
jgi:S-layer protein